MDPAIIPQSSTPTRARSLEPSAVHGESMDDLDASNTRKRPRLDSGERSYRSMSADRLQSSVPSHETTKTPLSPPNDPARSPPSQPSQASAVSTAGSQTPSKVTINVRDPSAVSTAASSSRLEAATSPTVRAGYLLFEGTSDAPDSNAAVSAGSSPSHSPEIEVAEIEDMDTEPAHTRWRTLGGPDIMQAKSIQDQLLYRFPLYDTFRSLTKAIDYHVNVFEKQDLSSHDSLEDLAVWIDHYVDATESLVSHWWELYLEQRDFWDDLPSMLDAILRRNNPKFGTIRMPRARLGNMADIAAECPLHAFLVAFSSLTLRMVRIDEQTLRDFSEDPSTTPDLVSDKYLSNLVSAMTCNASFWRSTVDTRQYDCSHTVSAMIRRFISPPFNGLGCLAQIAKKQSWVAFDPKQWAPASIMLQGLEYCTQSQPDDGVGRLLYAIPSQVWEFFQDVESKVKIMISKQVPAFSIDACQALIPKLASILFFLIAGYDDLCTDFVDRLLSPMPDISNRERPNLVQYAWKFSILQKCVREGRMEIRVYGVESMQRDLIEVYQKYITGRQNASSIHPISNYLSDWVLSNHLVDYLVGVESHPQLIQRSSNIIGFLVVTGKYTNDETDLIWNVLATTQDPSKIDALLNMVQGFINVATHPTLLHLIDKLASTPIHLFEANIIGFGKILYDSLRKTWRNSPAESKLETPPYRLCFRLIRESAADPMLDPNKRQDIHQWAIEELRSMLAYGPSEQDSKDVYDECLRDIAEHTQYASGSISALQTMFKFKPETEIKRLAQDSNLIPLLVKDLTHFVRSEESSPTMLGSHDNSLTTRLSLLMHLISIVPETITGDLAKDTWDVTTGSLAFNDQARNSAWHFLIQVLATQTRNSYIDLCIEEFLPKLESSFIVQGCLAFARDVAQYDSRFQTANSTASDRDQPERRSLGLLWQMSLAIADDKIELASKAIGMLITQHLDSPGTQKRSRAVTNAVHMELVERCIAQLTSAAAKLRSFSDGTSSGEDEPMIVVAPESEIEAQRSLFARSMKILQEFVSGVRAYPIYSPEPQLQPVLPKNFHEIKGEPVKLLYQSFSGRSSTEIRTVEVGDLETGKELANRFRVLTGFSHFTIIAGGQKLDLTNISDKLVKDLHIHQKGLLLLRKASPNDSVPDLTPTYGLRPIEISILAHFSDFYELLALEESLASQVYTFLSAFPPHQSITTLVCSLDTQAEQVFPPAAPFKILYSTHALRSCLVHQLDHGAPIQNLMSHSIEIITTTITNLNIHQISSSSSVDLIVAAALVECLLTLIKEPSAFPESTVPLSDPRALVDQLQLWIVDGLNLVEHSSEARKLVDECFAALLEASIHARPFLESFIAVGGLSHLLRRLLLEESKPSIRQGVLKTAQTICSNNTKSPNAPAELVSYLWESVATIIPQTLNFGDKSQQLFDLANILIRALNPSVKRSMDLDRYMERWCGLLLMHSHNEFVGRDEVDWIVYGLTRLVNYLFQIAKATDRPCRIPENFMEDLFYHHLFPEIDDSDEISNAPMKIPNLHAAAREQLLNIVSTISNDPLQFSRLLDLVKDLIPYVDNAQAWSWGIAQMPDDMTWEPNYNFERPKAIRAITGYPGLRNLSNTCYMNSLLTQLYMNLPFREFILGSHIADGDGSQRLLYQTRNLFGFLQDSFLKSVDTQAVADSIITYDNSVIDVSIQMDVDEFYNLLFDRWESQILDNQAKQTFRGFYGGQIVQQIKSKQCEHISERLEPFSAIQCDINGKNTLMESLNAYVSGEVMEGDNKYSCTSCGSYVDAVKRACLKDIPDNLIFHLKRFDYDVMTGQRSKINSRFEFPREIDMSPYHVDSLKNPHEQMAPDAFELVGVLVHSGSAETGHYYSYIQERPSTAVNGKTWVEFNDLDVSYFDPASIDDQCFGGWADPTLYSPAYPKVWNAYMLFYERMASSHPTCLVTEKTSRNIPAKCKLPDDLEHVIKRHNAMFLRQYCLFDPTHTLFARGIVDHLQSLDASNLDPVVEQKGINLSLDYLDRIQSRTKDCPSLEKMLESLTKTIVQRSQSCRIAIMWLIKHESALRNLLLRCPLSRVRRDFVKMIYSTLEHLRQHDQQMYGFTDVEGTTFDAMQLPMRPGRTLFSALIDCLKDMWVYLHLHPRSWEEYFTLLADLAAFGLPETFLMLSKGLLQRCLETLVADSDMARSVRASDPFYQHYNRLVEKGRKFAIGKLVELMANLLSKMSIQPPIWEGAPEHRPFNGGKIHLTNYEDDLLYCGMHYPARSKDVCVFLEKILTTGVNPPAVKEIIKTILLSEPPFKLHSLIRATIQSGISVEPAILAAPYLRAALTYCEAGASSSSAESLIKYIALEVDSIARSGGAEHLEFFVHARRLQNPRLNKPGRFFHGVVRRTVPQWAPTLLSYPDENVRLGTIQLLKVLLFAQDPSLEDDAEQEDEMIRTGKALCIACAQRCQSQIQKQEPLDAPKAWEQLIEVTRDCIKTFYHDESEDQIQQIEVVLGHLEALSVSDPEDVHSDNWNNSADDLPTSSDSENLGASP